MPCFHQLHNCQSGTPLLDAVQYHTQDMLLLMNLKICTGWLQAASLSFSSHHILNVLSSSVQENWEDVYIWLWLLSKTISKSMLQFVSFYHIFLKLDFATETVHLYTMTVLKRQNFCVKYKIWKDNHDVWIVLHHVHMQLLTPKICAEAVP